MAAIVSSKAVEDCLRQILQAAGYKISAERRPGETGVDILATKAGTRLFIEAIAYKQSAPARAKDFYEIFFRVAARLNDGAKRCIIALPSRFGVGLPARALHHRIAWQRIATAFPEIEIWLVDTADRTYTRTKWGDWLEARD
jgi:hypothetical protein